MTASEFLSYSSILSESDTDEDDAKLMLDQEQLEFKQRVDSMDDDGKNEDFDNTDQDEN